MDPSQIISRLKALVEPGKVLDDADSLETYGRDWTRIYEPRPLAIAFPKTTEEARDIVRLANELKLALVPSGGRTGLSAGAVAASGEVVVAFDYMNKILEFSAADRTARCQAGVVTRQLQTFAEERGLFYPVDFASAGSSQLGGNLSTNAGGIKVIRYGMSRDWALGLTVVTGRGDILELNRGLLKNATGYDLRHLFIGAEGTLGFITEATMRLTRPPGELAVLVLGLRGLDDIMEVLKTFQAGVELSAFEFFSDSALSRVLARGDLSAPFATRTPFYALLEIEVSSPPVLEEALKLYELSVERGLVVDGVMSQGRTQARSLWRLREDISESLARHTPYKNDISVTVSRVPAFLKEIDRVVAERYPDFEIVWFGHIGDGNLHLNVLKPEGLAKPEFFARCREVNRWVFEAVARHGGSISAEHGVGMTKKEFLRYTRSPEEIEYMRGIKRAFDPNNVMNPGKIFDAA
jgi:FAD/FMN-containing dehydrogenase